MSDRPKINRRIVGLLRKAQSHLNDPTIAAPELRALMHGPNSPLGLYLDTWVRAYLDAAIREIEGEPKPEKFGCNCMDCSIAGEATH